MAMTTTKNQIELDLIAKLGDLKYTYRHDIRDRAALEANFREKFEALNRVKLTESEFQRLLDDVITPDVYNAAQTLRSINAFERDDGTPLNYTLVNIKDWCKNHFEVINQLRINTDNSHHRYDVMLLINGVPAVQIELKTLAVSPRRVMQQIVDYKTDPGNGYGKTLLCFIQLFIVSNRTDTRYFANNNARHFSFNADERFLPVHQFAGKDNKKITHLDAFAEKFLAKCTLGQMISRYMVLVASEQKLMMMRPYQVYAVQAIVECIHQRCGNGYIWHTTGSGKTLTSFKASTLLKDTNHRIGGLDLYCQDVQKRIKDQQYSNVDLRQAGQTHAHKIDITIVVDMLLTGFDSKHLNTLYVDKNLKHHGLIQAFFAHQPRAQRQQALWQRARLPPTARECEQSHRTLLRREDRQTTMNREQLIGLIQDDAKFIAEYIRSLPVGQAPDEKEIRAGYERSKADKKTRELTAIAAKHGLDAAALQAFVGDVLRRRIFDGEALSELMAPLGPGWKARTQAALA